MSESQSVNTNEHHYSPDSNIIQIRLSTDYLIDNIESYLRGVRYSYVQDSNGQVVRQGNKFGEPKLNELGIQSILSWIISVINTSIVQGNFYSDKNGYSEKYEMFISDFRLSLAEDIISNAKTFGVKDGDEEPIVDIIMNMIIPFMTRLIDNKERESYGNSMKSMEVSNTKSRGFNLFKD